MHLLPPLPHCAHRAMTRASVPTRRTRSSTPTTPCAPAALAFTTTKQRQPSPLPSSSQGDLHRWLKKHTRRRPPRVWGPERSEGLGGGSFVGVGGGLSVFRRRASSWGRGATPLDLTDSSINLANIALWWLGMLGIPLTRVWHSCS